MTLVLFALAPFFHVRHLAVDYKEHKIITHLLSLQRVQATDHSHLICFEVNSTIYFPFKFSQIYNALLLLLFFFLIHVNSFDSSS